MGGSRDLCLGAKSPCHQGFNPGEIRFYFPRVGGSRELGLGAKSPCHQGFNPGEIKILFSKGGGVTRASPWCEEPLSPRIQHWWNKNFIYQGWGGHASLALVRTVLVTKASTLVKLEFYFSRVGGSRELGLGAKSSCHQGLNPGKIRILFTKGGGVTRAWPWCKEPLSPRLQPCNQVGMSASSKPHAVFKRYCKYVGMSASGIPPTPPF